MKGCPPSICVYISRKLAVASWSYSCFSKGRGRSESNTVIFHSNPPKFPGHFEAVMEADGHGRNSDRSPGNLYSAYPNPIKIPSCFQAYMNLSFHSPPLGLMYIYMYVCMYVCYVMLCYVMLCYVMFCYAMLCYVMYVCN